MCVLLWSRGLLVCEVKHVVHRFMIAAVNADYHNFCSIITLLMLVSQLLVNKLQLYTVLT